MGKTYNNQTRKFDDEFTSGRSGKHSKHSNNRKTGGMKTLNSYVEEDYDLNDEDFDDDIELNDEISIQHNTDTK
jgi:hypothetical protein